jgi:hypothetical protein
MSETKDPEGHEHVGDEYITYNRNQERRHRPDFPPFPPRSEEEEEAHRESERREESEAECEVERMLGDIYEKLEGSGKAPINPEATFMQVINDMLASQRTMSRSLAQVVYRLARVGTTYTQVPQATQVNSEEGNRPESPSCTYTSASRIPRPLFPSF